MANTDEISTRFALLACEYPTADWSRQSSATKAVASALDSVLWRRDDGPEDDRPNDLQVEAMWKAYGRAHS